MDFEGTIIDIAPFEKKQAMGQKEPEKCDYSQSPAPSNSHENSTTDNHNASRPNTSHHSLQQ